MFKAIINYDIEYEFENKMLLSDVIIASGVEFSMPCGGRGTCGKCKVQAAGSLSPLTKHEISELSEEEIQKGIRLSCMAAATGNIEIIVEAHSLKIESSGYIKEYKENLLAKNAIVIDIGTTTIAAACYEGTRLINTITELNRQSKFGADVISRIDYSKKDRDALYNTINSQLAEIIKKLNCEKPEIMVITANTTMLHFLMNLEAGGIAVSPFTTSDLFGGFYDVLGIKTYIPDCISAYIGADIVCGILACGMLEKEEASLIVDIGTNGEMAYFDGEKLFTASTAAGPAFEGAGIFMGMPAKSGAINRVYIEDGKIRHTTIDDKKAVGICGSGLIDAVAVMLDENILDETGLINSEHPCCIIDKDKKYAFKIPETGVIITNMDIRQVQLAKSAIKSGIMTLAKSVETLYIAGGFGAYINIENAKKIGLIPKNFYKNIKFLGNASLSGASLIYFSKDEFDKIKDIKKTAQNIELSVNSIFMDYYIDNMMFNTN